MKRWERWTLLTFVTGIALAYGFGIDRDHGWSDDSAHYVWHALNLVEGRPYAHLNFAHTRSMLPPPVFPPGLPLLLAALIPIAGVNFFAFKILMLVILLGCVALLPCALRPHITGWPALASALWFGLNPEVWRQMEMVNSEGLNLLFSLSFLILVQGATTQVEESGWLRPTPVCAVAAGLVLTLALATRLSALPLLGGTFLYLVLIVRKHRKFSAMLLVTGTLGTLIVMRSQSGPSYLGYLAHLFSWDIVVRHAVQYGMLCVKFLGGGKLVFGLVGIMLATGAIVLWRARGVGLWECWIACYGAMVLVWPFDNPARFGLPLILLAMAYTAQGLDTLLCRLRLRHGRAGGWAVAMALVVISYVHRYPQLAESGFFVPDAREAFSFIRERTDPDSVIVSRRSSILGLQTGRLGVNYPADLEGDRLWADLCSQPITHILSAPGLFSGDAQLLGPVIDARRHDLHQVFSNKSFTLLALRPGACGHSR